ncbi:MULTISPECIES: serine hydrolase [unclassified Lactobacillus]|uniref:serine hydrolase domain-containing protein n=1 Tax=unclassified Lactobacillus TaxID=2620435 RepID=UPI000EFAD4A6|nr:MULTISPECIES: serine hydrolase domain-containing protein [unclassified Lactobacillus]RMC24234.1 class A beta-lactamase-related serine hydrolase [Lactobacillus sp. ESL0247]RMC28807.1 class A beta-lactamase-related serine hydrolase [Lactobacillus sp. ESL0246]RMC31464.1 class A beta-lactamase-related serine hydrolase [Lactobacillus sp. ESL0245]
METNKINDLAQKMMSQFDLPSLGIGIYHKNEHFSHVYGAAQQDNLYPLASISKTFLATAICQLADQGVLNLDDPLKKYWPKFKLVDQYAQDHLTFRDALSHQSGLPAHDLMRFTNMNKHDLSLKEKVEHVGYLEPNHELRYQMQYSNLIYAVATYVMEQVIGQDYGTYEREHLLKPLHMNNTFINHHEATQNRIVKPYIRDNNVTQEVPFIAPGKVGGASSMLATISDLLTWAEFQLKTQKSTKEEITAQRYLPQSIMRPSRAYGEANFAAYGLGMMMEDYRGHKYFYHSGSYIGYCSFLGFVPDLDLAFVFTTNMDSTDAIFALAYQVIDETLGIKTTNWTQKVSQIMTAKIAAKEQHLAQLKGMNPQFVQTNSALLGDYENPGYGLISLGDHDGHLNVTIGKWDYPVIINEQNEMFVEERLYQHELLPISLENDQIALLTEPALKRPTIFKKKP